MILSRILILFRILTSWFLFVFRILARILILFRILTRILLLFMILARILILLSILARILILLRILARILFLFRILVRILILFRILQDPAGSYRILQNPTGSYIGFLPGLFYFCILNHIISFVIFRSWVERDIVEQLRFDYAREVVILLTLKF